MTADAPRSEKVQQNHIFWPKWVLRRHAPGSHPGSQNPSGPDPCRGSIRPATWAHAAPQGLPPDLRARPAIVAAPDKGQSVPSVPEINLNEPDMQKHTVEVRIGVDEDDRWWVVVIVDANDNEAVWRGPYEDQEVAQKEGLALTAEIDDLDDEGLRRFIAQRGLPPTRH